MNKTMHDQIGDSTGADQSDASSPLCVLIHGVGYIEPGENVEAVRSLASRSWPRAQVEEFCWCSLVPSPMQDLPDTVDFDYFRQLATAVRAAAWLGHLPETGTPLFTRGLQALSNLAAGLFYLLSLVLPFVAAASAVSWLVGRLAPPADSVWGIPSGQSPMWLELVEIYVAPLVFLPQFHVATVWVLIAMGTFAGVALLLSTCARGRVGFREELRRLLITVLWPLAWAFATFSIYPIVFVLVSGSVLAVYVFGTWSKTKAFFLGGWDTIGIAFLGIAITVLILLAIRRLNGVAGYYLKPLADVFLYLGDQQYRERLLTDLRNFVNAHLAVARPIVLASHSLGSVIAADYLRLAAQDLRTRSVLLFTMGSPLARLFRRFFPSQFPSVAQRVDSLATIYNDFNWINVYRPLDFIGARLAGKSFRFVDASTGQLRDPFSSHTAYWSDERVLQTLQGALRRLTPTNAPERPLAQTPGRPPSSASAAFKNRRAVLPHRIAFVAAVALALSPLMWALVRDHLVHPYVNERAIADRAAYLDSHGERAIAKVRPYLLETKDRSGDSRSRVYRIFAVHLDWHHEGQPYGHYFRGPQLLIDMKKLKEDFRNPLTLRDNYHEKITSYSHFDTPVVFDPNDDSRMLLDNYRTATRVEDGLHELSQWISLFTTPILTGVVWFFLLYPPIVLLTASQPKLLDDFHEWLQDRLDDFLP